jgi:hypothetical protein
MKKAASILDFERAAEIRNQIKKLKNIPFWFIFYFYCRNYIFI